MKSNQELRSKINISNQKYEEILSQIKEKENEKSEASLAKQIKELEKEIKQCNKEASKYKKIAEDLKNKIDFKNSIEKGFDLHSNLQMEIMKNKDLAKQIETLQRINKNQMKCLNDYDKDNLISEKLDILKSEIKEAKDNIKDYQEKYLKQDRFIRSIHEKILFLESLILKMKEPKHEETKSFTLEQFKQVLNDIKEYSNTVNANRNKLSMIQKGHEDNMHNLLSQNKKIEKDYKDIIKENKALVFQRNEVKKKIKYCNIDSNKYLSISPKRQNNELEKIKSQGQRSSSQINSERENKNNNISTINYNFSVII